MDIIPNFLEYLATTVFVVTLAETSYRPKLRCLFRAMFEVTMAEELIPVERLSRAFWRKAAVAECMRRLDLIYHT
jgi:hypothetical protein